MKTEFEEVRLEKSIITLRMKHTIAKVYTGVPQWAAHLKFNSCENNRMRTLHNRWTSIMSRATAKAANE